MMMDLKLISQITDETVRKGKLHTVTALKLRKRWTLTFLSVLDNGYKDKLDQFEPRLESSEKDSDSEDEESSPDEEKDNQTESSLSQEWGTSRASHFGLKMNHVSEWKNLESEPASAGRCMVSNLFVKAEKTIYSTVFPVQTTEPYKLPNEIDANSLEKEWQV